MKKIISFLNTDIKIINSYFLFTIVLIILVCVGYSSYALFSFTKTSTNVIEGTVGELKKSGTDTLIKLTDNKDNSGLYTITHPADNTLQIGTNEDIIEYRYRGASPKNYVTFNGEMWRIIGVFPTDDGTGKIENRIKLIRNESIGEYYWNTSRTSNWGEATLNTYLNGDYYNTLTSEAQNMIGSAKYYLGGYNVHTQTSQDMYSYERKISGSDYYYGSNPTNWVGKLALMYESDYGYASANCETKKLYIGLNGSSSNDLRACNDTNWLYNIKVNEWLLSPFSTNSTGNGLIFIATSKGHIGSQYADLVQYATRPVLYLISSVQITGGNGTSSSPYTLGL